MNEKCPKCHCPLYNWPHDGDPGLPRNHEIGGKHCLERQLSASEAEIKRLRGIEDRLRNANLSQTGWEAGEDIVLLNGKPVGATITRHRREFDRWWEAVKNEILSAEKEQNKA